jgi:hypothetical protein
MAGLGAHSLDRVLTHAAVDMYATLRTLLLQMLAEQADQGGNTGTTAAACSLPL